MVKRFFKLLTVPAAGLLISSANITQTTANAIPVVEVGAAGANISLVAGNTYAIAGINSAILAMEKLNQAQLLVANGFLATIAAATVTMVGELEIIIAELFIANATLAAILLALGLGAITNFAGGVKVSIEHFEGFFDQDFEVTKNHFGDVLDNSVVNEYYEQEYFTENNEYFTEHNLFETYNDYNEYYNDYIENYETNYFEEVYNEDHYIDVKNYYEYTTIIESMDDLIIENVEGDNNIINQEVTPNNNLVTASTKDKEGQDRILRDLRNLPLNVQPLYFSTPILESPNARENIARILETRGRILDEYNLRNLGYADTQVKAAGASYASISKILNLYTESENLREDTAITNLLIANLTAETAELRQVMTRMLGQMAAESLVEHVSSTTSSAK